MPITDHPKPSKAATKQSDKDMYQAGPPLSGTTLVTKSSTSFSSASASPTRLGLLFGELDQSRARSSSTSRSACSLIQTSNSSFLRFWLDEQCRESLLDLLEITGLASLRLTCLDSSIRAAPRCFKGLESTFRSSTFKPSRLAALERVGHHVECFQLNLIYSDELALPPLIDPYTGEERAFVCSPRSHTDAKFTSTTLQPKYGDWETTDLLIRQYPPLFHAATNAASFVHALSVMPRLSKLAVKCINDGRGPRHDLRSPADYALVSLRVALQQARLPALRRLCLDNIHAAALRHFSSSGGLADGPSSLRTWSRIRNVDLSVPWPPLQHNPIAGDQAEIVRKFLNGFPHLERLRVRWNEHRGPSPFPGSFPTCKLSHFQLENASVSSHEISSLIETHLRTLRDLKFKAVTLAKGTWDEALSPLTKLAKDNAWRQKFEEVGDVPIMLDRMMPPVSTTPLRSALRRQGSAVQCGMRKEIVQKAPGRRVAIAEPAGFVYRSSPIATIGGYTRHVPTPCLVSVDKLAHVQGDAIRGTSRCPADSPGHGKRSHGSKALGKVRRVFACRLFGKKDFSHAPEHPALPSIRL